jgi:uncharacterized protein (TIGR03083 family)
MSASVTAQQWSAVRSALLDSGERFARLLSSCDPGTMATREWTVADTGAHVTAIALWDTALAQAGEAVAPYPWDVVRDLARVTTVDTVYKLNDEVMSRFAERDPEVLATQLRIHIGDMLASSAELDPDNPVGWLGGSRIPLAAVFAHLTNELQIHGRDIARATGHRWVTPPPHAAQFFEIFVAGITRHGVGRLLYRDGGGTRRRIAVQFLSRYSAPLTLVLGGGHMAVADGDVPVDVRLRFDPATLNLVLFGRVSQARAVLSGKVVVSGPRPWLLPAFRRTVRFPS